MKKTNLIVILILGIFLSGCSLIPRITMDTPNTLPQAIDRSTTKYKCAGKIEFNDDGSVKACSKGYYNYETNYQKKERKMTIVERIKSFINNLVGWGFWGVVLLVILCPSLVGLILGRVLEATGGVAKATLSSVVNAVQQARKQNKDLTVALDSELDKKQKIYIKNLKVREKIK
jgi:hypothetical protein